MSRVVVVGGGVAGLRCAGRLERDVDEVVLLERDDRVGGRVRTDRRDGFLLDRGFQVLPTAYQEARSCLDLPALDLRPFRSGALVRAGGKFHRLHHPLRHPGDLAETLFSPLATPADKLRLAAWMAGLLLRPREAAGEGPTESARRKLRRMGFSAPFVERVLAPFLAGIFLDAELETSARFMDFVLRTFASGPAALPAGGMEAIPRQLAAVLTEGVMRTGVEVVAVDADAGVPAVRLADGSRVEADAVVVATDPWSAARLLQELSPPGRRSVTGFQYGADGAPVEEPILVLNGTGEGPVNHLAVPSRAAPTYAPEGRELISVSVVGTSARRTPELEATVRAQMAGWFGPAVERWELLQVDRLPGALPALEAGESSGSDPSPRVRPGVYVCGDHCQERSLDGALRSGTRAAGAVLEELQRA